MVFLSNLLFNFVEKRGRALLLLLIIPIAAAVLIYSNDDILKVAGMTAGFITGYLTESKYIQYDVRNKFWKQAVKYISGMLMLLAIKVLGKYLLPDVPAGELFTYFLMGLWITAIAPCLFKLVFSERN